MSGLFTALVASFVEGWAELRVHRGRVLLSLIGVGIAVAALTVVVAAGGMVTQAQVEQSERWQGRPATLTFYGAYDPTTGTQAPADLTDAAVRTAIERYDIAFTSRSLQSDLTAVFPDGSVSTYGTVVDTDYGEMHRLEVEHGRWLVDADSAGLAPALVVNEAWWQRLGSPALDAHPTTVVRAADGSDVTAVIVGVTPSQYPEETPTFFLLTDDADGLVAESTDPMYAPTPTWEFWVPTDLSGDLRDALNADLSAAAGDGWQVDVSRSDYMAYADEDPLLPLKLAVLGVAALVLLLGALGLVNISLVTVRARIREIGIRRAFGATAPRVFFGVMMESVVATLAAGIAGVLLAILVVQSPWVQEPLAANLQDVPAFPLSAALAGIAAATVVGALAGVVPALVAVRVRVVDAIRY